MDANPFRDDSRPAQADNPNVRKGQFLWKDAEEQNRYLGELRTRISRGYYYSENIVDRIVEEIAPVIDDCIDRELSLNY